MELGSLLSTILAVSTVVGVALAGLSLGTTRTLRASNTDLRDRIKDQEVVGKDCQARCSALEAERDALRRTVTAEDAVREVGGKVDALTERLAELDDHSERRHAELLVAVRG